MIAQKRHMGYDLLSFSYSWKYIGTGGAKMAVSVVRLRSVMDDFPELDYILGSYHFLLDEHRALGAIVQSIEIERADIDFLRSVHLEEETRDQQTGLITRRVTTFFTVNPGETQVDPMTHNYRETTKSIAHWLNHSSTPVNERKYFVALRYFYQGLKGFTLENAIEITIYRLPKNKTLAELVAEVMANPKAA